jgi:F-type H+-transporting ATPase subunit epsilon
MVVAPGVEGELGILPRHEALVSLLAIGETRVRRLDGDWERFASGIGYLQVLFNKVMIVVDQAEQAGKIDVERAQVARKRAEERLALRGDPEAEAEVDFYRAELALKRAENRLKVASRA